MIRRGYLLLEVSLGLSIGLVLLGIGGNGVAALLRAQRQAGPPATLVDLACDRLRRDLTAGAQAEEGALMAGGHRWTAEAGTVRRDGLPRAGLADLRWERDGRAWRVVALPAQGAPRTLRVEDPR